MFSILRCCPLRISEFFEMRFMNHKDANFIDLQNSCICIRQHKNGTNERIVKLDDQAVSDLKTFKYDNPYVIEKTKSFWERRFSNLNTLMDQMPVKLYRSRLPQIFSPAWWPTNINNQISQLQPDIVHLQWIFF